MTHFFKTFFSDTSGAAAAEYALILAIVGSAIALAAINLGTAVGDSIQDAADCVTTPTAATC
jgi:pilus assembly protein Flp/PilA